MAIPKRDVPNQNSAADGLKHAISSANATATPVGAIDHVDQVTAGHMGADCRVPDAYVQNVHTKDCSRRIRDRFRGQPLAPPFVDRRWPATCSALFSERQGAAWRSLDESVGSRRFDLVCERFSLTKIAYTGAYTDSRKQKAQFIELG
ncbi:hypothetical protein AB4Y42_16115 [Paraburkholderia sp. EG286B]|uniref:hypothetical protein n=1 Tax=Paraburkholderia sp. EG286B TaxID=3237011 RepID=UPI0034D291F3